MHTLRLLSAAHNEEVWLRRQRRNYSRQRLEQMPDVLFRINKTKSEQLCHDLRANTSLRGTKEIPLEVKLQSDLTMKPNCKRYSRKRKLAPSNIECVSKTSSAPSRKPDISRKHVARNEGTTNTSGITRVWSGATATPTPQAGRKGSRVAANITDLRYGLSDHYNQLHTHIISDPHNNTNNQLQLLTYDQNFQQQPTPETLRNICGKELGKPNLHEHDYCIIHDQFHDSNEREENPQLELLKITKNQVIDVILPTFTQTKLIMNEITKEHNYALRPVFNKGISTLSDQISSLGTQVSFKEHTISAKKCEENTINVNCSFDNAQLSEDNDETVSTKSFGINAEANEDAEQTVSIGSFETMQCDFCSIEYMNKGDLLLHIQEKHLEIKPEVLQGSVYSPANDLDMLNAANRTTEETNGNCLEFKTEDVDVHSEHNWGCDTNEPNPVLNNHDLNLNEINHASNETNINEENVIITPQHGFELSEYERHEEKFKDLLDVETPQDKEFTENFVENEPSQTAKTDSDQLLFALCANCSKFSSEFKRNDNGVIICQTCQQSTRRSFDLDKHQKHEEKCKDLHDDAYEHELGDNFVQVVDENNLLKPLKVSKRNVIEQTMVSCSNCYMAMPWDPNKDYFEEILCGRCGSTVKWKRKTCKICKKSISFSYWNSHIRKVHGKDTHVCKVCKAEFKCKKYLKIHSWRIHECKNMTF